MTVSPTTVTVGGLVAIGPEGRVEAGFTDLTDRVEGIETRVEDTLSQAAARVEKAVEQAEHVGGECLFGVRRVVERALGITEAT